jgi:two-component system response regulator NreC
MIINLGIYGEHRLVCEGIETLFRDKDNIHTLFVCYEQDLLNEMLKTHKVNILIMNINEFTTPVLNQIFQIDIHFPKIKMLVLSKNSSEEVIYKIIRSGAKGFLSQESAKEELYEAVHTLRHGHDYYSKSITHLLLNKYIKKIKSNDDNEKSDISTLSQRQIEILKLWGASHTNQEIADRLFISIRTVETHKNHIMQKLNLRTTVDMVKFAIKNNLIEI